MFIKAVETINKNDAQQLPTAEYKVSGFDMVIQSKKTTCSLCDFVAICDQSRNPSFNLIIKSSALQAEHQKHWPENNEKLFAVKSESSSYSRQRSL